MKVLMLVTIPLIVALTLAQTQSHAEAYARALASGLEVIPAAREFRDLFAGSRCDFSYYTGVYGTPTLNCKTLLHRRYVLTLRAEVKFDETGTKVVDYGEPAFHLKEVESVEVMGDGRVRMRYGELQREFGAEGWAKVLGGRGEFSVIGVELAKGRPVSGIDEAW